MRTRLGAKPELACAGQSTRAVEDKNLDPALVPGGVLGDPAGRLGDRIGQRNTGLAGEVEGGDIAGPDGKLLGEDQGEPITLRTGRFGPYVQRRTATEEEPKPPRASIPKGAVFSRC